MKDQQTIGDCQCYLGDSLELLRATPDRSIDFILTDIPYELDLKGGGGHGTFANRKTIQSNEQSSLYFVSRGIDYDTVFTEFERVLHLVNLCVFCSNKQISRIMSWWEQRGYIATLLTWEKPNPLPVYNHSYVSNAEFIVYVRENHSTFNNLGLALQKRVFHYSVPPSNARLHET